MRIAKVVTIGLNLNSPTKGKVHFVQTLRSYKKFREMELFLFLKRFFSEKRTSLKLYPIFGASLSLVWDGLSNFGRGFLFMEEFCTSFWISNSFLLPSLLKSADILPTKQVSKLILGKIPLMFRIDCFNEFRPCFHFSHSFLDWDTN